MSFPGFTSCITVKWCHFLNLPDCSSCSIICLYPLNYYIHITDDYLSQTSLCKYFGKAIIVNPTISLQYRYQSIWSKIMWYLIFSISPSPNCSKTLDCSFAEDLKGKGYSHRDSSKHEHENKIRRPSPETAFLQHPTVSITSFS